MDKQTNIQAEYMPLPASLAGQRNKNLYYTREKAKVRASIVNPGLLLLVCVSFTIIGQPRNGVLIRRV